MKITDKCVDRGESMRDVRRDVVVRGDRVADVARYNGVFARAVGGSGSWTCSIRSPKIQRTRA